MGTCASLYGRSECSAVKPPPPPETVTDSFEIPPSPIKHFKLHPMKDKTPSGSKEEAFFDSRGWLDSDCEDFFSVKGDFTPSCGNTPLHHRFPAETPRASKAGANDEPSTVNSPPSPAKRSKKLADLFRDDTSFALPNHFHEENQPVEKPCISGAGSVCSSGRTVGGDELGDEIPNGFGSKLCCIPPLVSRHSSSERKEDSKLVNGVS